MIETVMIYELEAKVRKLEEEVASLKKLNEQAIFEFVRDNLSINVDSDYEDDSHFVTVALTIKNPATGKYENIASEGARTS